MLLPKKSLDAQEKVLGRVGGIVSQSDFIKVTVFDKSCSCCQSHQRYIKSESR